MLVVNSFAYPILDKNTGMSIGKRAREARREAKLTQGYVCDKIGIKQPTLSALETGESEGTAFLGTLASVLGVNALWLQTGRGPKRSSESPVLAAVPAPAPSGDELAEIISGYLAADTSGRSIIRQSVRVALGSTASDRKQSAGNDPQ